MARAKKSGTHPDASLKGDNPDVEDTESTPAQQVEEVVILEESDQEGVPKAPPSDLLDAAIDADDAVESPEAVQEPVKQPVPPLPAIVQQKSGAGFFTMLLGGAGAAALGFAASQYLGNDDWPFSQQPSAEEQLSQQVTALTGDLETLTGQVSGLSSTVAKVSADQTGVSALQDGQSELRQTLSDMTASQATLAQRVTDLENRPIPDLGANKDAVAAYQEQLASMRAMFEAELAKIQAAKSDVTALEQTATEQSAIVMRRATVARLQSAVDSGAGYSDVIDALAAEGVAVPVELGKQAEQGVPTLAALQQGYPSAARAALDASIRAQAETGEVDKLTAFLRTQLGARSLAPKEGTDPDAVLSRAEAALRDGDLSRTLLELDGLPPAGADQMADWTATARLRQDALAAIAAVSETLNN